MLTNWASCIRHMPTGPADNPRWIGCRITLRMNIGNDFLGRLARQSLPLGVSSSQERQIFRRVNRRTRPRTVVFRRQNRNADPFQSGSKPCRTLGLFIAPRSPSPYQKELGIVVRLSGVIYCLHAKSWLTIRYMIHLVLSLVFDVSDFKLREKIRPGCVHCTSIVSVGAGSPSSPAWTQSKAHGEERDLRKHGKIRSSCTRNPWHCGLQ